MPTKRFALLLVILGLLACDKRSESGSTVVNSGPASNAAGGQAANASGAAAFPKTAIPAKSLESVAIGVPPGAKLEAMDEKKASLEAGDYKILLSVARPGELEGVPKMKDVMKSMSGFKSFVVDAPDGFIAESGAEFNVVRYVKAGDVVVSCSSAMTKAPKTKEKAKELYDVCGSLAKK